MAIGKTYDHSFRASYRAGETVIRYGDAGEDIYILLEGTVEVIRYNRQGRGFVTATLGPGQAFGEMGFIMEEARDISVRAVTDIDVEIVSPRVFAALYDMEGLGRLIRPIIQAFSERLRASYARSVDMEPQELPVSADAAVERGDATVVVIPRTSRAREAMNGLGRFTVSSLPFYIGRYSQRRSDNLFHANTLLLFDRIPFTISRSHCAVAATPKGVCFVDRGSTMGSIVNDVRIGGARLASKSVLLRIGDNEVVLGDRKDGAFEYLFVVGRR